MHRERIEAIKDHIGVRPQKMTDYPSALARANNDIVWLMGQVEFFRRHLAFYESIDRVAASRRSVEHLRFQRVDAVEDGLRHDGP